MMTCAGIPMVNSSHPFQFRHKKEVSHTAKIAVHIKNEMIKKLSLGLNQIELNTNHTIMETGIANTNANQWYCNSGIAISNTANTQVATNHTNTMEIPVINP